MPSLGPLLTTISRWVEARTDIDGFALIGSWARGTAASTSDVDLMLLVPDPQSFRTSRTWLDEIDWSSIGSFVRSFHDATYGAVWSRHVKLDDGMSVEFAFASPSWAITSPLDPGTRAVILGGFRVLYDPNRLLETLVKHVA